MDPDTALIHAWATKLAKSVAAEVGITLQSEFKKAKAEADKETAAEDKTKPKPKPAPTRRPGVAPSYGERGQGWNINYNQTVHAHAHESLATTMKRAGFKWKNGIPELFPPEHGHRGGGG
jgi:hypothetical protein